ncbi:MAG TPA: IPT/TIG domain-containing protein [Terriglobia bacterium]|nr:IPT/TIG domain-containing protein [Terriglobia bacterium]
MRSYRITVIWLAIVLATVFAESAAGWAYTPLPDSAAADAAPKIASIQPSSAQPGSRITVKIAGENFPSGAYVTFSDPAIHVIATRRTSETELEVDIAIGEMAKQQSVVLYVSNPSGASAQTRFAITSATNTVPVPQQSQAASPTAPIVTKVDPSQAAPGSKQGVKVTGKNFKEGAKVAFSNPGIRVLGTEVKKSTQLIAKIEVATNAPAGKTSLFVINPDDSEVEAAFEVGGESSTKSGTAAEKTSTSPSATTQQFSVYNLGDATSIFQDPGKAKGDLAIKGGKLEYEQDGQVVFAAKPAEIQEIAPNVFFGLNTGTFHIILTSGKTYNFVATSLAPADTNSIIEKLRSALK